MACSLFSLSFISTLFSVFSLTSALAVQTPAPYHKNLGRRDLNHPTISPLGYVTPSPGAIPSPITAQGQEVTTYVPEFITNDKGASSKDPVIKFITSSYRWYSTYIPGYLDGESQFVSRGDQIITLSAKEPPSFTVRTVTVTTTGTIELGNQTFDIKTIPTEIAYAKEVSRSLGTCKFQDYIDWEQYNKERVAKLGSRGSLIRVPSNNQRNKAGRNLRVDFVRCHQDECTTEIQDWSIGYRARTNERLASATIKENAIETITRTRAITTKPATDTGTLREPSIESTTLFRIRVRYSTPTKRLLRRQLDNWYVGVFDNAMAVVTAPTDIATFSISKQKLKSSGSGFAFAAPDDLIARGPVLFGGEGELNTIFAIEKGTNKLVWKNQKFRREIAAYCVDDDYEINGVYSGMIDSLCDPVELTAEFTGDSKTSKSTAQCSPISSINHIKNPSFESGDLSPWKTTFPSQNTELSISTSNPNNGSHSILIELSNNKASLNLTQQIPTCPGRNYSGILYLDLKITGKQNSCALYVLINGSTIAEHTGTTSRYTKVPFGFTSQSDSVNLELLAMCTRQATHAIFHIDDVMLKDKPPPIR